jgi:hypothetical protein
MKLMRGDMGECWPFAGLARELIEICRWCRGGCVGGSCHCEAPSSVRPRAISDLKRRITTSSVSTSLWSPLYVKICLGQVRINLATCKHTFWTFLSTELNRVFSVYAMNGKSVEIDNTDAEGRLILSGEILRLPRLPPV